MAGIGFELRKMMRRDTLTGVAKAYVYAGVISSGPLILSIIGMLLIGVLSLGKVIPDFLITQFQVSVTYLIASSLILTGFVQLAFTRFMSDRLFEKRSDLVLPNFNAIVLMTTLTSGLLGIVLALTCFAQLSPGYRALMLTGFVILSNIWVAAIVLSSVKQYKHILGTFLVGYAVTVGAALMLNRYGLEGLLLGFVIGHFVLLLGLSGLIYRNYPSERFVAFEVVDRRFAYPSLVFVGFLYNLGIWLDKFMFWFGPGTGQPVIGPLRASAIYDIPVFISYLCVMPGMAVFLVRIEADFVEFYDAFYDAVRSGATLAHIQESRDMMVRAVRAGLYEILKIQAVVILLIFAFGDWLLEQLGISTLYAPLLRIDVIAASLQVLFLGALNVFFYLDQRRTVLGLSLMFVLLNGVLTALTLHYGPATYGYGFAGALLLSVLASVYLLDRKFDGLEYETYMLQRG
ncbi:MAG: exopolysaccharide Pel transporter PelG [Pararobbsia sp.]